MMDDDRKTMIAMVAAGIFIFRPEFSGRAGEVKGAAQDAVEQAEVFVQALEDELGKL